MFITTENLCLNHEGDFVDKGRSVMRGKGRDELRIQPNKREEGEAVTGLRRLANRCRKVPVTGTLAPVVLLQKMVGRKGFRERFLLEVVA